jgi:hypothetical protein
MPATTYPRRDQPLNSDRHSPRRRRLCRDGHSPGHPLSFGNPQPPW